MTEAEKRNKDGQNRTAGKKKKEWMKVMGEGGGEERGGGAKPNERMNSIWWPNYEQSVKCPVKFGTFETEHEMMKCV